MKKILALVVVVLASACVFAQEPMKSGPSAAMDLSSGIPTAIADTVVLPVNAFEVALAGGYVTDGIVYETGLIALTYGVLEDVQITAKWPMIFGEGKVTGNGDTTIAALWAPWKVEDVSMGIELAGRTPTGEGFTGYDGTITGIATMPIGEVRAHVNAGYTTIGNNQTADRAHTDSFKLGMDYMAMDDVCVILDVFSNMAPVRGADRLEMVEAGVRYAMTEVDIISAGVAVSIGNGNATPDFVGTLGYQREF